MKILALYVQKTLPILRRVQAPFSTLATRGHGFSFTQVARFEPGMLHGHDVTVLPNWVLTVEENAALAQVTRGGEKAVIYDLSDPALLEHDEVQRTMRLVTAVTVPNEYMRREVQHIIGRSGRSVRILPSVVDVPYFMTANSFPRCPKRIIGCFGPHDWHLAQPLIAQVVQECPNVHFIGDTGAHAALGDALIERVDLHVDSYPRLLHDCALGLCPLEGESGQDTIWSSEWGIFCKPVIVWAGSPYSHIKSAIVLSRNNTSQQFREVCSTPVSSALGQLAFQAANAHRSTEQASQYLRAYREMLPHLR